MELQGAEALDDPSWNLDEFGGLGLYGLPVFEADLLMREARK
jgi:hypothetical protein